MSRADRALYQAKSGGRNRVEQATAAPAASSAAA
jgi:PleD family two-component response regulator